MSSAAVIDSVSVGSEANVEARYLRNTWYAAAWSQDLGATPLSLDLLEEEVLVYRTADGNAVTLGNRCPHRFAELHRGKVVGENIQCPYHGLQFGPSGACAHNPHGGHKPAAARVKSYPTVERYGLIWVWMGHTDAADADLIPDCSILDDPACIVVRGTLNLAADYLLYVDNLMDLSHTEYVHAFQVPNSLERSTSRVDVAGNDVIFVRDFPEENAVGPLHAKFVQALGGKEGDVVAIHQEVRWMFPCTMLFEARQTRDQRSVSFHALHTATPTSRGRTRLLWTGIRNFMVDDEQFTDYLSKTLDRVLSKEDFPPIESQQTYTGDRDLLALKPVLLPTDEAAVRCRRILKAIIARERQEPMQTARRN
jgi:phenylpropionate dioxygenase-like ring-hydroxylating dioxygenase large terminal subunit